MRAATDEIRLIRRDNNGPAVGVSGITILRESDSGAAAIYTTRGGSTTIPQSSLTSDQDGYVVQPGGAAGYVDLEDYLVQAPGSRAIHWDVTGGAVNSVNGRVGDVTGLGEAEGVYVEQYLALAVDHDAAIEAAITAAAATGAGTPVVLGRIYDIDDLHVFDTTPPIGGPTTGFHATSASGGIRIGTALGTGNPRNLNKLTRAGGFIFDGGGVSTVGVQTKTTNWRYDAMTIFGCAAGTNALSIWGQNNHYDVWAVSTGTGFCIAFDNGAGGNRVRGKVNGTNFVLFDQTVTQSTDYYVPTDNILDGLISDQPAGLDPAVARYCVLQRFGYENVIRDCNLYHGQALAGIKYERGAGGVVPAGHDWNGNLKLEGRNMLTCPATGSYAVWADFVSGGVAGQAGPFNNVLLSVSGTVLVSGVDGDFKWGCTNPCVGAGVYWPRSSGTRPFWTTDGTGAASGPKGTWNTDSRTGIGRSPDSTAVEIQGPVKILPVTGTEAALAARQVAANPFLGNRLLDTDAQRAFQVLGDGKHSWGAGGSAGLDTHLYRDAPGRLKTDADFFVGGRVVVNPGGANLVDLGNGGPRAYIGDYGTLISWAANHLLDIGLAGSTATSLRIPSPASGMPALKALVAVGQAAFAARQVAADAILSNRLVDGDAERSFEVLGSGKMSWGPGGSTAPDTSLERGGVGVLTTPGTIRGATPVAASDYVTKAYADAVASGLDVKQSVRAASVVNQSLAAAGSRTVDGVSCSAGDRVLLRAQTAPAENGIYVVASDFSLGRSSDADTSAEVTAGMFTFATEGSTNAGSGFVLTTPDPITLGTTALTFTQFSGAGEITAGTGLTKSGNTLAVDGTIVEELSRKGAASGYMGLDGSSRGAQSPKLHHADHEAGGTDELKDSRIGPAGLVQPILGCLITGGQAPANANQARFVRCVIPKSGTLHDVGYYVSVSSGNAIIMVYDVGEASAGNYTKLWDSGSIAVGTVNTWQTRDPALAVTAGKHLLLAIMFDNTTAQVGRLSLFSNVGAAQLPANFLPDGANGSAKLAALRLAPGFAAETSISEANMSPAVAVPVLIGRVT